MLLSWALLPGVGCSPVESGSLPRENGARELANSVSASSTTGSMQDGRAEYELLMLSSGKVMAVGGTGSLSYPRTVELYNPATGTWSLTGSLSNLGRSVPAAVELSDGRILLTGGDRDTITSDTDIYNPSTGSWSRGPALKQARAYHTATRLNNGKVLIVGGMDAWGGLSSVELYDPANNRFTLVQSMQDTRSSHTATLLADGRVLVVGGANSFAEAHNRAEIYNPATGNWTATPLLKSAHTHHRAARLSNGKVLVVGGYPGDQVAELYDPATNTWSLTGSLNQRRMSGFDLALCADGRALVFGGSAGWNQELASVERYDAATGTWTQLEPLGTPRQEARAVSLGNKFLIAAGHNAQNGYLNTAELYTGCAVPAQDMMAAYDANLKAPRCDGTGRSCDSGELLVGRANLLGPEPNAPNTLHNSCMDGSWGTFHSDESLDRLKVYTLDGGAFAAGKQVRIEATVWAFSSESNDILDLFYTRDVMNPAWTLIGSFPATASGAHTLSATYTLPAASRHAIRGQFRFSGNAVPCSDGSYDDHDDLVFDVN